MTSTIDKWGWRSWILLYILTSKVPRWKSPQPGTVAQFIQYLIKGARLHGGQWPWYKLWCDLVGPLSTCYCMFWPTWSFCWQIFYQKQLKLIEHYQIYNCFHASAHFRGPEIPCTFTDCVLKNDSNKWNQIHVEEIHVNTSVESRVRCVFKIVHQSKGFHVDVYVHVAADCESLQKKSLEMPSWQESRQSQSRYVCDR